MRSALHAFDFESLSAADRQQALRMILAQAGAATLSIVHCCFGERRRGARSLL